MARTCTICVHESRAEVEAELVRRVAYRDIARRFSVSKDALSRHAREHLPATLARAREAAELEEADGLLGQVRGLQSRTLAVLEAAEESREHRTALAAIAEARRNLELLAKLLGELDERPVNVLISPEWLELRAVIVGALAPHEEARSDVLRAIQGTSNGRGWDGS